MFSGNCFSWLYLIILGLLYNMTVKGGTSPACAACKYQRRRCLPSCPLAPYFPANQPKTFQYVHRVFGVSNVTKTLKNLQTKDQRDDAMKSMIFEAEMRAKYPVHGCSAIIFHLRNQLNYAVEELKYLYEQLEKYREGVNNQFDESNSTQQGLNPYSCGTNSGTIPMIFHDNQYSNEHQSFVNDTNWFYGEPLDEMNKSLLGLQLVDGVSNISNIEQAQMVDEIGRGNEIGRKGKNKEYEGMNFNIASDYNQYSYIETMEASETWCPPESSQKNSSITSLSARPQVCNSELKNAAADFSLTTI